MAVHTCMKIPDPGMLRSSWAGVRAFDYFAPRPSVGCENTFFFFRSPLDHVFTFYRPRVLVCTTCDCSDRGKGKAKAVCLPVVGGGQIDVRRCLRVVTIRISFWCSSEMGLGGGGALRPCHMSRTHDPHLFPRLFFFPPCKVCPTLVTGPAVQVCTLRFFFGCMREMRYVCLSPVKAPVLLALRNLNLFMIHTPNMYSCWSILFIYDVILNSRCHDRDILMHILWPCILR